MTDIENNGTTAQNDTDAEGQDTILLGGEESKDTDEGAKPAETKDTETNKDDGDKGDGKKTDDKADDKADGAPEEYAKFEVPEGMTAPMDEFKTFAKEMNMSQESAQKVVDFYSKTFVPKVEEMHQKQIADWKAESEKQFNKEAIEVANRGIAAFATPELKTLLVQTGLGNHPQMVKLFNEIGTKISEPNLVSGQKTVFSDKDMIEKLYPGLSK